VSCLVRLIKRGGNREYTLSCNICDMSPSRFCRLSSEMVALSEQGEIELHEEEKTEESEKGIYNGLCYFDPSC
jgi:hypothetical protein